ncbi:Kinesin motor domain [Dillenia turbinata]|uniref:Kinesin-like protein n=1 Tax=Dillenia turbinata TaxID=194707 RepID=A0AAN8UGV6_9MAGN
MSNVTVCARFRPLSAKERADHGDGVCIRTVDTKSFIIKDEKDEDLMFSFDKVFYEGSEQVDVYEFLALPIIHDVVNGINGTIIIYGQGPSILDYDKQKKGLLPRVVDGLFEHICSLGESTKYLVKLSMVEIYMEKVRDLFELAKDNIQIKESKTQGVFLSGVTEILISDAAEALQSLSNGIANRTVGETQMNMASSRSHCIYILTIEQGLATDKRVKTGKLVLVDLAGSEKADKTGAEGRILEEAKTINKSLSALGNVINALTSSSPVKTNHIPYRDSKLTRILKDALGGHSQMALLCCCSSSLSNASESLSTLRFGARAKHIKASICINCNDNKSKQPGDTSSTKDDSYHRIISKLRERLDLEDVKLLEELFLLEGIFFDPDSVGCLESALEDVTVQIISSLQRTVEELVLIVEELEKENKALKAKVAAAERSGVLTLFVDWVGSLFALKMSN